MFGDNCNAIERMLLVTMLQEALAGSPVAGAVLHSGKETTQPGKLEETNIYLDDIVTTYAGLSLSVGELKARLADAELKVEHQNKLLETAGALTATLAAASKGWRIPQRGDRLRLVKPVGNLFYGHDWIAVGDIVKCEAIGACIDSSIAIPVDVKNSWLLQTLPGDQAQCACLPLDCFEPVTEE